MIKVGGISTMTLKRIALLLVVAVAISTLATTSAIATTPTDSSDALIDVEGVVSINGEPGWAGIVLGIEDAATGDSCGTATTGDSGSYSTSLDESCAVDVQVFLVLEQTEGRSRSSETLDLAAEPTPLVFNPVFALTPTEIVDLPPAPRTVENVDGAAGQALVERSRSVFDEVDTLLIYLLTSGAVLLTIMAAALLVATHRRYQFLTHTFDAIDKSKSGDIEQWVHALQAENLVQESRYRVFRWMVEGLVLSFVVIAIIALGAAGKVEAQGIVSVLAAMVGYAAGRASS